MIVPSRIAAPFGVLAFVAACNLVIAVDGYRPCTGNECDASDASPGSDVGTTADASDAGVDCLGAPNVNGVCQPTRILGGIGAAHGLASDGKSLYFDVGSRIRYCKVPSCGVNNFLTPFEPSYSVASQLALDPSTQTVFFGLGQDMQFGVIERAPIDPDAGGATKIATTPNFPGAFVLCGDHLCWIDMPSNGTGTVQSCAITGCSQPTTVMSLPANTYWGAGALTSDGTNVYVALIDKIVSCPITGCMGAPTLVVTALNVHGLAFHQGKLYFVTNGAGTGTLARCDPTFCTIPEFVAKNLAAPWNLAVDDAGIFWTSFIDPGQVLRCPLATCPDGPSVIAQQQASPSLITTDATRVYWMNSTAGISDINWVAK